MVYIILLEVFSMASKILKTLVSIYDRKCYFKYIYGNIVSHISRNIFIYKYEVYWKKYHHMDPKYWKTLKETNLPILNVGCDKLCVLIQSIFLVTWT